MTGDRGAELRVQQYYGELLAGFRRRQADIAAEQAAKLATRPHHPPTPGADPPLGAHPPPVDDHDFSHHTWLR